MTSTACATCVDHPQTSPRVLVADPAVVAVGLSPLGSLRTVVEISPSPMWIKNLQRQYICANQAYANLLGMKADELLGQTDDDLMVPAAAQASASADTQALTQEAALCGESCLQAFGGEPLYTVLTRRRLSEGGRLLGLVGSLTTRGDPGEDWEAREKRLLFHFSQVAHELRSPAAGVLGLVRLILEGQGLSDTHKAWLQAIDRCEQHIMDLSNDMVDIGLVCAGKITLRPKATDVNQLLEDAASVVRPLVADKPVAVRVISHPCNVPGPRFVLDALRVRQLLINLLSNAARHTHAGYILLQAAPMTRPGQTDDTSRSSMRLRFEITDSGEGMPPEQVAELFSCGKSLHDWSTTRGTHRGGLGLMISRRLARAMGGELQVVSSLGVGTTFWFEIDAPICPANAMPA
jgi:PAS domain S-box-containing protein